MTAYRLTDADRRKPHKRVHADEDGLTPRRKIFLEHIANGLPILEAYVKAGFKANSKQPHVNAYALLKKPGLKKYLAGLQKEMADKFKVTREEVIAGLKREATLSDEDGGDTHGRTKAWVALGKHLGLFQTNIKVEGKIEHSHTLDLDALVKRLPGELQDQLLLAIEQIEKEQNPPALPYTEVIEHANDSTAPSITQEQTPGG